MEVVCTCKDCHTVTIEELILYSYYLSYISQRFRVTGFLVGLMLAFTKCILPTSHSLVGWEWVVRLRSVRSSAQGSVYRLSLTNISRIVASTPPSPRKPLHYCYSPRLVLSTYHHRHTLHPCLLLPGSSGWIAHSMTTGSSNPVLYAQHFLPAQQIVGTQSIFVERIN